MGTTTQRGSSTKKKRKEKRREEGRHFPFAVRLLGTSSRSVPLTGEVRANRGCPLHLIRRDGHPGQSCSKCRVLGLKTRSAPGEKRVNNNKE